MSPVRCIVARIGRYSVSLTCLAAVVTAHAAHPDFSGVWQATKASASLSPVHGAVPFTPSAAAIWQEHVSASKAGHFAWDSANQCIPLGTPRAMAAASPLEIVQEPTKVTVLFQLQRLYRTIPTDGWSNASSDPTFMGISMGHWDGDALVIETNNFKTGTFINDAGIPHSDQLKVTERWTLTNTQTLTDQIEIQDPQSFTAPWSSVLVLKRLHGMILTEDVCVDRVRAKSVR